MYPESAKITGEEFPEITSKLRAIAEAEGHREELFRKLLKEVEANTVFKNDKEV